MIVIKLVGGLASQLHKYAVAKAICDAKGASLRVDCSFYSLEASKSNGIMNYNLPKLGINPKVATEYEVFQAKTPGFIMKTLRQCSNFSKREKFADIISRFENKLEGYQFIRDNFFNSYFYVHIAEPSSRNWQDRINDPAFISGEFGMSFELIQPVREEISALVRTCALNSSAEGIKAIIESEPYPVSVHVRRGDYVHNKRINSFHGTCDVEYYKRCIKSILHSNDKTRFFVFSDDISWVKKAFADFLPEKSILIEGNQAHEDFSLISNCKCHVVANSGFSSFAAWLSMVPGNKIYSPSQWLKNTEANKKLMAMLPGEWNYY